MNPAQAPQHKRVLLIIWIAQLLALVVYIAITYVIPGEPIPLRPEQKVFVGIFQVVGGLTFLAGLIVERTMMSRVKTAAEVQVAGILSACIGEAVGVYGLLVFFLSHQREWVFFAISGLYFLRLFLRLPEFYQRIDAFTQQ
jgi:hypothetical protein